jgi:integrase
VLTLYRRHTSDCPFYGKPRHARGSRNCKEHCPIWVQGSLRGEYIRRALNLTSWEAASDLILKWDASGTIGEVKPEVPTVREAVDKFFADALARKLSSSTIQKQKNVLEKRLLAWCEKHGYRLLKSLDVDAMRRFRATWPDAPITASRNLERLRNFFGFCQSAGWIASNPAKAVRPPKVTTAPTLPFEPEEFEQMLAACDDISTRGPYREGNRTRLKAMLLLLRYSGLRIRDAATLERSRIKNGKLFLYTQKTGTPVWLPLPPVVLDALKHIPNVNSRYFFWSGNGDPKTTVADWQRSLRRLLDSVGIDGHFHMLRDTAAVGWLVKGVPIETVSILLGHSGVRITEKHYSPWVKQRQMKLEEAVMSSWA